MHSNEQPPSYTSDTYNTPTSPAANGTLYRNDNSDNSNTRFKEPSSFPRHESGSSNSNLNLGRQSANNDNNNTQTTPPRSESWLDSVFRVNSHADAIIGNLTFVCLIIQILAIVILVFVSGIAMGLYRNSRDRPQVINGATLSYGLAGTVLGFATGILTLACFPFTGFLGQTGFLVSLLVTNIMYATIGALTGYGSYITRYNEVCHHSYAGLHNCYNIRLSDGWRCGIVTVVMCAVIM
ncbi:hypothetical protein TSTA_117870 [Talaromyces stipitatus ATCC 10500]|uniref:Uncharacterized protein n=1 Tax=Talaromyces stipitatus (strain ATCC 10500 / CBS 375.48 / QM 6759 / NRRL 1006) TaxID=441959 RepID=B8M9L3_TALSN|nr:uncharacterized protein TSTA_117870 [Talaromyces stipitatus ATCC 10500]EED18015.1 hypothetical protein TSTA_117870 [Talaromyces stipitatus ATCC 10500]